MMAWSDPGDIPGGHKTAGGVVPARRLILAPENPFIDTLNIYRYFIGRTSANMFFKATARIFAPIG